MYLYIHIYIYIFICTLVFLTLLPANYCDIRWCHVARIRGGLVEEVLQT